MLKEEFYSDPQLHQNIQFISQFIEFIQTNDKISYRKDKNHITINNENFSLSLKNVPTDPFYPFNTNWFLYFTYNKSKNNKYVNIKAIIPETYPFINIFNSFQYTDYISDKTKISQTDIINFLNTGDDSLFINQLNQSSFQNKNYSTLLKDNKIVDLINSKKKKSFASQCIQFYFNEHYYLELTRPSDYSDGVYASYKLIKIENSHELIADLKTLNSGSISLLNLHSFDFLNNILAQRDLLFTDPKEKIAHRYYFREPITLESPDSLFTFDKINKSISKFVQDIHDLQYENELFSFFNWKMELENQSSIKKAIGDDSVALNKRLKI